MSADSASSASESAPLSTGDALQRLDDAAFVDLIADFWERRRWTVEERRDPDTWYVDLSLRSDWPIEQRALLRIKRPSSRKPISGADVQRLARTVQQSGAEWGTLIVPEEAPRSARNRAATYDVNVLDRTDLGRLIDRWSGHDLLAERVGRPVVPITEPLTAHVPDPVDRVLERFDVLDRVGGLLDRYLPPNSSVHELAQLSFTGFRVTLTLAVVVFLSTLLTATGSIPFLLLTGVFVLVTYGGLLPLMAVDIYLVRRYEETAWTPAWASLASFLLAPLLFVIGGLYWYRRRRRTESGRAAAWRPT